jgi:tetratricopeptide (TPR) repeat protein/DNA-binding winged helix-turn-helix (wHTH) protein
MTSVIYRVNGVLIDTGRRCIEREGQEIQLRDRPFRTLLHLVEHAGRVITKDELHKAVWKDIAVTDDAIVQSIVEIRSALKDERKNPTFIRTVSGVGYRFIATVDSAAAADSSVAPADVSAAPAEISVAPADVSVAPTDVSAAPAPIATQSSATRSSSRVPWWGLAAITAIAILATGVAFIRPETRLLGSFASAGKKIRVDVPFRSASLPHGTTNDLEAYRLYERALDKLHEFRGDDAAELLKQAISRDPDFAMAYARIGYAYAITNANVAEGKPYLEKAFQLSNRLTEKDRLNLEAWYAIANQDFPRAIGRFREVLEYDSGDVETYWRLAALLYGEERYAEGLEVIKRGLLIDPEAKELYNELGRTYLGMDRVDDAFASYKRYIALVPKDPNAYDSLGMAYGEIGEYDKAIEAFRQAEEVDPRFEIVTLHMGAIYFRLGQYGEAIEQFNRYITLTNSSRGYENIAWVKARKGDISGAVETIRYGQEATDSDESWYPFQIAVTAMQRGVLPQSATVPEFRAWNFSNRGYRLTPIRIHYIRGARALMKRHFADAITEFQEAVKHRPMAWDPDTLEDCLGNAYLILDRLDEAIGEYQRVLGHNPNNAMVRFHLAQAYERKGMPSQANAEYERFVGIWDHADSDLPELLTAKQALAAARSQAALVLPRPK